jgi:bifunctional UDP-N-acetylglucosamine pyrophosphorylase/glucosamine-1-phosphate N-acetyltransferase
MSRLAIALLAAGQSTRMRSRRSKLLHPLAGRPLLLYPLRLAEALRPNILVVVLGHAAEEVRTLLPSGCPFVLQEPQLGTGHAVQQAQPLLEGHCDELLVLYGDTPLLRPETLEGMRRHHEHQGAAVTLLSAILPDPSGYGRVLRDPEGQVCAILEEADTSPEQRAIREVASGIFLFRAPWLWKHLPLLSRSPKGEYYLTELVALAVGEGERVATYPAADPEEVLGVNDRVQLAQAERVLRRRIARRWMLDGVTIVDPESTYIDDTVEIGQDTVICPNTHLLGATRIGEGCEIGPNSILVDTVVGNGCRVFASVLEEAVLEDEVRIGPFGHLRKGAHLARGVRMGNFGEVKNAYLGPGVKMGHFSYIGDAEIGAETNIGAGTITCNFDTKGRKNRTVIGKRAYIGSDTMLVAPVEVGDGAVTGAGSVVTRSIPPRAVAYGVPARVRRTVDEDPPTEDAPQEGASIPERPEGLPSEPK